MASTKHSGAPAQFNRRRLLSAAPAFGLAGMFAASAVPALAAVETPVMLAYREWKALRDFVNHETDGMPEDEFNALCDRTNEMVRAMAELPNHDMNDAALKLWAFTDSGRDFGDDGFDTGLRLVRQIGDLIAA